MLLEKLKSGNLRYCKSKEKFLEQFSNKESSQAIYSGFGPFYETYLYAFFIGFHKGLKQELGDETATFYDTHKWKYQDLVDLMITLSILNISRPNEWIQIEDDEEMLNKFVRDVKKEIEETVNGGLKYLEDRFAENEDEFDSEFAFVNLYKEVIN